jgi:hypothetical protein
MLSHKAYRPMISRITKLFTHYWLFQNTVYQLKRYTCTQIIIIPHTHHTWLSLPWYVYVNLQCICHWRNKYKSYSLSLSTVKTSLHSKSNLITALYRKKNIQIFIFWKWHIYKHVRGRRGHSCMIVRFTTTCVISDSLLKLWVQTPFRARCNRYNIMW